MVTDPLLAGRIQGVGTRCIDVHLPCTYLGADDHAGANYTGQPAVNAHYRENHRR
jgi:hypothetical protein